MTLPGPALECRNLTKRFGDLLANDSINLRVEPGTIHGLIGENGAGKTTAMRMCYGMIRPDAGEILVFGQPRRFSSPRDAIAAGIGMVHQHFMLAGPYSALDNIILGTEPRRGLAIDRRSARAKLQELTERHGLSVEWDQPIENLPVGVQQRVEILKLLYRDAKILILDEPTAVLTPQETAGLFENLRKLRDEGKTIILITHKLKEVMGFTDRVTVLRAGKVSGQAETSQTSVGELAEMMVGRQVTLTVESSPAKPREEAALEVTGLSLAGPHGRHKLSEISFTVRRGEIVGIAGVDGNGQSELVQAILHPAEPRCRSSGIIRILGQDVTKRRTAEIRALGVALIPEDRHSEGLLLEQTVSENFILGLHRTAEFSRAGFLRQSRVLQTTASAMEEFDVRPRKPTLPARNLSGGNQQKLIFAREFHRKLGLLIAAQPTRGLDVGAIEFIHRRILDARDSGAGVLLISFELDEILALSDRILVMYEGRIAAEYARGQVNERELGLRMGGS
jgi:general nucleoside transport system ATP-binding protein